MIEIPNLKGKELFDFLIANKTALIAQKKYEIKKADAIYFYSDLENNKGRIVKANTPANDNRDEIEVTSIINTTYWMDSHKDVHIDGLWKKSLSETKQLYLLQEHSMTFKGIITDDVKAYTKKISWQKLGVNSDGYTEALVFESKIRKERNDYMFDEYRKGHVKNHSVGMQYVSLDIAVNDENYPAHYELWKKYIDKIANKEMCEDCGYFWPVTEAKVVEGSAVPIGSNTITPTQSVKNIAPASATQSRAAKSTRMIQELNNLSKLLTK